MEPFTLILLQAGQATSQRVLFTKSGRGVFREVQRYQPLGTTFPVLTSQLLLLLLFSSIKHS